MAWIHAVSGTPEMDLALIEDARVERKKNGIAAANAGEVGEIAGFRPVKDVAHRAITERDVPVHEPRAFFRQSQKSRTTHLPAGERLALIRDLFH